MIMWVPETWYMSKLFPSSYALLNNYKNWETDWTDGSVAMMGAWWQTHRAKQLQSLWWVTMNDWINKQAMILFRYIRLICKLASVETINIDVPGSVYYGYSFYGIGEMREWRKF